MNNKMTLKKARLLSDFTQIQAAKKLKTTPATIVNIENGHHVPRADLFMSMCKLYGIKCEDISF